MVKVQLRLLRIMFTHGEERPTGPAVNHQQRPPASSTTEEPQQDTPTSAAALLLTDPKMEAGGTGSDHRAILPAAGPHSQASRASPAPPPGYPRPTPRVGPKLQPRCRQMSTKPSAGAGWRGGSPSVHPRTHKSTGQTAAAPVPVIHIPPPAPRCCTQVPSRLTTVSSDHATSGARAEQALFTASRAPDVSRRAPMAAVRPRASTPPLIGPRTTSLWLR
ncbi:hypothetical protein NDU88_002209 [Pleurodeles waltl]|uniref:Uncharacterized protein n=1 Tax=Pleurodeles waltl TaxID=8319 RepID=A0AAV7TML6_PLEWA|nr:hypothetical protein NDU88_002209 [Pleurodeles waltl]